MLLLLSQHNTAQHRSTDPQRKRAGKAAVGTNALHNSGGQAKIVCLHRWWANRGQTHSTALDATVADEVLVLFVATITIPQRWSDRQCTKPRHQHSIDTNHTPKTDSKHKTHTHTHISTPKKPEPHAVYAQLWRRPRSSVQHTYTTCMCGHHSSSHHTGTPPQQAHIQPHSLLHTTCCSLALHHQHQEKMQSARDTPPCAPAVDHSSTTTQASHPTTLAAASCASRQHTPQPHPKEAGTRRECVLQRAQHNTQLPHRVLGNSLLPVATTRTDSRVLPHNTTRVSFQKGFMKREHVMCL